jgi:integrase
LIPLTPCFESLVEEYARDALFSEKLSDVTARTAKSIIKGFLLDLESTGFTTFDGVNLEIVNRIITQTAATHYTRVADSLLHYVKDFLTYLYAYEFVGVNLSVAVPKIAAPFKRTYQGFADDEIRRLLAAVDRSTSIGKRDYAMMILAAQTGLRAVDVVKLRRGDIDWRNQEIHISQSKTGKALCVTLEPESGNAICDYILNARQECDLPNVFLRAEYPLRSLNPSATLAIVSKHMALAGIVPTARQRYGFHSFRRAFGTRLLESGTPVHLLSQLLGHMDIDSAVPYLSASDQGLKMCCLSLTLDESEGFAI